MEKCLEGFGLVLKIYLYMDVYARSRVKEKEPSRRADADKPEWVRAWGEDADAGLPGSLRLHDSDPAHCAHPDTVNFMPRCFIN